MTHHHPVKVVRTRVGLWWASTGWSVTLAYTAIGIALILQPDRFERTPSYGNLLSLLDAPVWGVLYLGAAAVMAGYLVFAFSRVVAIVAHTYAAALTAAWLMGFVVRYLTNFDTTVVNVVSWSIFLFLVVRSGTLIATFAVVRTTGRVPVDTPEDIK